MAVRLVDIPTPALVLDLGVLQRNLSAMSQRMKQAGVNLRPHLKTAKSIDLARLATQGHSGGIAVSTLREAEYFSDHGISDISYCVPIVTDKLDRVATMQNTGATVRLLTDDLEVARAMGRKAKDLSARFGVFIEIDSGYHRSGVHPESEELLAIGRALHHPPQVELLGVLTHAGHSYRLRGREGIQRVAEEERAAVVRAAERLRAQGFPCPAVSVGSTPTAVFANALHGVTETRPGNYMFFDLAMCARGVCRLEDIAVSVLTVVIAQNPEYGHALVDAGALALSKDVGVQAGPMASPGYGLVCDTAHCRPVEGVIVKSVSQEQGWLGMAEANRRLPFGELPVGRRLRILPNHSCLTSAAYDRYYVVDLRDEILAEWPRVNGW
ncbi:MAG: alanine racemase [Gemmatimonadetes bacterium]|nr:alanine racemase [Gemmatimonadota bacterium]